MVFLLKSARTRNPFLSGWHPRSPGLGFAGLGRSLPEAALCPWEDNSRHIRMKGCCSGSRCVDRGKHRR